MFCTDEYGLHTLSCQFGCSAQVDMYSHILLVYLQSAKRCFAVSNVWWHTVGSLGCAPNHAPRQTVRGPHTFLQNECAIMSLGALLWWILRIALCTPRLPDSVNFHRIWPTCPGRSCIWRVKFQSSVYSWRCVVVIPLEMFMSPIQLSLYMASATFRRFDFDRRNKVWCDIFWPSGEPPGVPEARHVPVA